MKCKSCNRTLLNNEKKYCSHCKNKRDRLGKSTVLGSLALGGLIKIVYDKLKKK